MTRFAISLIIAFLSNASNTSASEFEGRGYSRGHINWAESCGAAVYDYVEDVYSGLGDDESYRRFTHRYLTSLVGKNRFDFDKEYKKMMQRSWQMDFEDDILFPAYEAYQCTGFDKVALSFMAATNAFEKLCFYHGYSKQYDLPTEWTRLPC